MFPTAIEVWNIVKTIERCEDLEKDIDKALKEVKSAKATAIELEDDVSEVEANITIVSNNNTFYQYQLLNSKHPFHMDKCNLICRGSQPPEVFY